MIYEIIDTRTGERANEYELVQEPWVEKTRGCDWPAFAIDEDGEAMLTDDCGNYDMVPEGRVEVRLVVNREKLCGEWQGEADGYADGELVYDMWYCSGCGYEEETDDPDLLPSFCPHCGLAMTDAAWAELEKKIRGCVE